MPNEIVDLRYPYMFYSSIACKVLRTIEYISTVGSTVVLLAVAVDRYNRICNLGKQQINNLIWHANYTVQKVKQCQRQYEITGRGSSLSIDVNKTYQQISYNSCEHQQKNVNNDRKIS
jgi:hypothetical protein